MCENCAESQYIPQSQFESLMTGGNIRRELDQIVPDGDELNIDELTEWILGGARKVFAILVIIKATQRIQQCRELEFCDTYLPIPSNSQLAVDAVGPSLQTFRKEQWVFLSPVLTTNLMSIEDIPTFHSQVPLPFNSMQRYTSGTYGVVYKCQIQEGCLVASEVRVEFPVCLFTNEI